MYYKLVIQMFSNLYVTLQFLYQDTTNKSKKIIFDDLEPLEDNETSKKQKLCWDSDEEEEEFKFPDDDELNSKAKTKVSYFQRCGIIVNL